MLLLYVVREIFALEDAVSFNFALGAPHVKRRVKSRRPASAAPTQEMCNRFNEFFVGIVPKLADNKNTENKDVFGA